MSHAEHSVFFARVPPCPMFKLSIYYSEIVKKEHVFSSCSKNKVFFLKKRFFNFQFLFLNFLVAFFCGLNYLNQTTKLIFAHKEDDGSNTNFTI